jgi:hypothetical protein
MRKKLQIANIYRVRYKKGDVELDIESSDREYVDRKLAELWKVEETQNHVKNGERSRRKEKTRERDDKSGSDGNTRVTDSVLAEIVASVSDANNYEDIGKYVLDRPNRTARILMCYYFAHKHPRDPALTSTNVELITKQLRIGIAAPNVAKVIREGASKYLMADRVRKRGFAVHYKINRRGIAIFEKIVSGQKTSSES